MFSDDNKYRKNKGTESYPYLICKQTIEEIEMKKNNYT